MQPMKGLKCLSAAFALTLTAACGVLPAKHVSPIVKTETIRIPITEPPRPAAIPERDIGLPLVITTDRLVAWLAPVLGPNTADRIAKVLAQGKMPDLAHVCWTLDQDDELARMANDEATWRRQALKYMQSVEDQIRKIHDDNEASAGQP